MSRTVLSGIDRLRHFYSSENGMERNLFEIWEDGGARGDSITPSVASSAYRAWMRDKLLATGTHRLLSLGSGNAAVERELVDAGVHVLAVDAMQEAVDLARAKGVDALCADVTSWAPDIRWPVVYSDGLLGHLYDAEAGLTPFFARVRSWIAPGGSLVVSNDSPKNGEPVQAAPGVPGFHWLSGEYLREQALAGGFSAVTAETFTYQRPLSGERVRAVVTAVV